MTRTKPVALVIQSYEQTARMPETFTLFGAGWLPPVRCDRIAKSFYLSIDRRRCGR